MGRNVAVQPIFNCIGNRVRFNEFSNLLSHNQHLFFHHLSDHQQVINRRRCNIGRQKCAQILAPSHYQRRINYGFLIKTFCTKITLFRRIILVGSIVVRCFFSSVFIRVEGLSSVIILSLCQQTIFHVDRAPDYRSGSNK